MTIERDSGEKDGRLPAADASVTALSPSGSSPSVSPAAPLQSHGAGFTPGPWFCDGRLPGTSEYAVFAEQGVACVARVQPGCLPAKGRDDATAANARLIAAAPDLYEALTLFERQWNACGPNSDFGRYFQNVRDAAVSALAKADEAHWLNTSRAALARVRP